MWKLLRKMSTVWFFFGHPLGRTLFVYLCSSQLPCPEVYLSICVGDSLLISAIHHSLTSLALRAHWFSIIPLFPACYELGGHLYNAPMPVYLTVSRRVHRIFGRGDGRWILSSECTSFNALFVRSQPAPPPPERGLPSLPLIWEKSVFLLIMRGGGLRGLGVLSLSPPPSLPVYASFSLSQFIHFLASIINFFSVLLSSPKYLGCFTTLAQLFSTRTERSF